MSLQRLRIGEDTDGLYRAIDAVGRAEYSYFGTWSPFLRRTPHGVRGLKYRGRCQALDGAQSHPARRAWIEIFLPKIKMRR